MKDNNLKGYLQQSLGEKVYKETSQNSCVSGVDHRGTATACQPSCRLYSMERNCVEWSGIYSMVSGKKNRGKR